VILEWIWAQLASFIGWLLSLFPTLTVPEWVGTITSYLADGVAVANGFHMWVPLTAIRVSFLFLMACGAAVLAVRGFLFVLSLFTGGGGNS
jgi:hypothetical protein